MHRSTTVFWIALPFSLSIFSAIGTAQTSVIRALRFPSATSVELSDRIKTAAVQVGERFENWTIMSVSASGKAGAFAVLEDFTQQQGHLIVVGADGIRIDMPKSLEPTSADPASLYLGHSRDEIINSSSDILAEQILAKPGDPDYDTVASVFPPIQKMNTYSFIGTQQTADKVVFTYGGRSPNFDPAPYYPPINKIREEGRVLDGLVGGYLPILRFVFPESEGTWTEMLAFAPLRFSNGNDRIQPAWYRIVHVENGRVAWSHYIDSYHPFPPRTQYDPNLFYADLIHLQAGWRKALEPAMTIEVPDEWMENMARFGLVREMMTRIGDFPKYGVVDRDYGASEHDGFPDTFTVDTAAMLEWGLTDLAGRYIDNYFGKFVRDDGSLLYRGPETGQYGRMLTVLAQYANYGGDTRILLKQKTRIDGVTKLLLGMREKAKQLPKDNAAYGMLAGWSEADASLDPDPPRYMQPYFSNSTEAARGFRDLGRVWIRIGKKSNNPKLVVWDQQLVHESEQLQTDIQTAISRSLLHDGDQPILPSIAGVKEPFHVVVPRDPTDPQFRSYRAYIEMMYSGLLTKQEVETIVNYRKTHHDTLLGVPTAYGFKTGDLSGFLAYGHGYGLVQYDKSREALLMLYSIMAHQYTRGTWTAPETRPVFNDTPAAPYCTPAQLVVALMTKWILVFEDPQSETLWLGKAMPAGWLAEGKSTAISNAPTRWGRVGFSTESHLADGKIEANIKLPPGFAAVTKLHLRVSENRKIQSVLLNGKPWSDFSPEAGTITIPAGLSAEITIIAKY